MKTASLLSIAIFSFAALTTFCACNTEDDLDAQNRNLADRLTESLKFDHGDISDEDLPEWQSIAEAPQITEYDVPLWLQFDKEFTITLKSEFLRNDEVDKAIVYVSNATRHIKVSESLKPGEDDGFYEMQLTGRLEKDDKLEGEEFRVHVALQTDEGITGEYILWEFKVTTDEQDTATEKLIKNACRNIEEYCSDGDYTWNIYRASDFAACTSTYSCTYDFYQSDSNCRNNLNTGVRCLEELNDSDDCNHCDKLFRNMPGQCDFPSDCITSM